MRILHLATHDSRGGAARAALRLHLGLCRIGQMSAMLVRTKASHLDNVAGFRASSGLASRMLRFARRRFSGNCADGVVARGYDYFSSHTTQYGPRMLDALPDCDIVNLHWIADFVDLRAVRRLAERGKPVVWTLHDMNAFTGGCHYDDDCGRYHECCGQCPQIGSHREMDRSRKIWTAKQCLYGELRKYRFQIVTDSHWLAREAAQSPLLTGVPVTPIHYGLDTEEYQPRDRAFSRHVLGLPLDARVILFSADSIANRRKGMRLLLDAFGALQDTDGLRLLSMGGGAVVTGTDTRLRHLGHITNDRLMSVVYSCADVFAIPSIQEAFGQTALEAMACGVPVVGFDVGGIPDQVIPMETGLLARPGDAQDLAEKLRWMLTHPEQAKQMGLNGRERVLRLHTLEAQAAQYLRLYQSIVG